MEETPEIRGYVVDLESLPPMFPTHLHSAEFWEHLGRTIATFGHLEEVLGKAIFALTAAVRYGEAEIEGAFERWLPTLERALIDPWGGLIESRRKAYRSHPDATSDNLDDLIDEAVRRRCGTSCATDRGQSRTLKGDRCPLRQPEKGGV